MVERRDVLVDIQRTLSAAMDFVDAEIAAIDADGGGGGRRR